MIYVLAYTDGSRELRLEVDRAFPHRLHGWVERSGQAETTATRRATIMSPYWQFNKTHDRQRRIPLGLSAE